MEDADAVQIDAPLPPQGQTPLPQPDPLPAVAHRAARQPRRKEKGGEQQGHGQAGQGGAGDEGEQGAEGKGCSGGSKKDETALFCPGQKVRRHPKFGQKLPEERFLPGTVNEERQLRGAAARRHEDRPAPHQPGKGGKADVGKADLVALHPALEPVQPAAAAADLGAGVPDLVVHAV